VPKFLSLTPLLSSHLDSDSEQEHARGAARLPRAHLVHAVLFFALSAEPALFKQLLMVCFARYYADHQMLPRRDVRADAPPEFSKIRHRDLLPHREEDPHISGHDPHHVPAPIASSCRRSPGAEVRRAIHRYAPTSAELRVKARVHRADRRDADVDFKGVSRAGCILRAAAWWRSLPGGGEMTARDRRLPRVRQDLRRPGPAWIQVNDVAKGRARACRRRSSGTCTTRAFEDPRAHQREKLRVPAVSSCRQGQGRQYAIGALRLEIGTAISASVHLVAGRPETAVVVASRCSR